MQLEDVYGSPSMDDITSFSREFYAELETALGEEAAGNLQIEVSSPVRAQHSSPGQCTCSAPFRHPMCWRRGACPPLFQHPLGGVKGHARAGMCGVGMHP